MRKIFRRLRETFRRTAEMVESTRSDGQSRCIRGHACTSATRHGWDCPLSDPVADLAGSYGGWPRLSTWTGFPDPDDDTDGVRCSGCGRFVPCRHCPSDTPVLTPEQAAAWDEQEAAWNAHAETERAAGRCEFSGLAVHDCHTSICDCFESWDCACVKESQRCRHCGALSEDDGDHSCPCPPLSPGIVPLTAGQYRVDPALHERFGSLLDRINRSSRRGRR